MKNNFKSVLLKSLSVFILVGSSSVAFAQQAPPALNPATSSTPVNVQSTQTPSGVASNSASATVAPSPSSGTTPTTNSTTVNSTNTNTQASTQSPVLPSTDTLPPVTSDNSKITPAAPAAPAPEQVAPPAAPSQTSVGPVLSAPPVMVQPPPIVSVPGIVLGGPSEEYSETRGPRDFTRTLNQIPTTIYSPDLPGEK